MNPTPISNSRLLLMMLAFIIIGAAFAQFLIYVSYQLNHRRQGTLLQEDTSYIGSPLGIDSKTHKDVKYEAEPSKLDTPAASQEAGYLKQLLIVVKAGVKHKTERLRAPWRRGISFIYVLGFNCYILHILQTRVL